jgi:lipopolysaccharide biosynthesis glycosyltransferase
MNNSNNNSKQEITVVCAADNNYAMPLGVTACSIIKNLDSARHLNLYVLDGGIESRNKDKLIQSLNSPKCTVKFVDTKGNFKEVPTYGHFNETTFYRLLIPEFMPKDLHKVIYLDCDLLVLTDISKLWEIEIGDHHLLAVRDFYVSTISKGVKIYRGLGIPANSKYFNGGVLVFNLDKWRQDNTSSKIIEYVTKPRDYILFCGDQEALNVILWDKWGELDPKWNQQVILTKLVEDLSWVDSLKQRLGEAHYLDIVSNPYIKHFASPTKPWQYYQHPEKLLFYQYIDQTAWAGWRNTRLKVWWHKLQVKFQGIF